MYIPTDITTNVPVDAFYYRDTKFPFVQATPSLNRFLAVCIDGASRGMELIVPALTPWPLGGVKKKSIVTRRPCVTNYCFLVA